MSKNKNDEIEMRSDAVQMMYDTLQGKSLSELSDMLIHSISHVGHPGDVTLAMILLQRVCTELDELKRPRIVRP